MRPAGRLTVPGTETSERSSYPNISGQHLKFSEKDLFQVPSLVEARYVGTMARTFSAVVPQL